jgi:Fe-S oxidoreductase
MFGEQLVEEFRTFKSTWDPDWKMNPGKKVDAYRITDNLRFGTSYRPPQVHTHFAFEEDRGDFAHAATRCVGIGKCRRTEGGVMCPSFMVTRDEKHTTRGRAHLLWEMLNGDELEAFKDEEVFEALDLCLSCKGCTHDCPVNVDMPTLKAEFLSHYYAGKPRPRHAYAFGLIDKAARLAARAPRLANLVTQSPVLSAVAKRLAGVAPERKLPPFAEQTLQTWFRERGERNLEGPRVVLWPDTFTNHFDPAVGVAAVETLEASGFHVVMPQGHVCCGRPLYDYGMLDLAGRYLDRTLRLLRDEIRSGTPIVGLEPSCVAVFKDELRKMRPNDEDAKRLCQQVHHLAEFLAAREEFVPPQLERKVVLHGHCHHKATGGIDPEQELLEKMGAEVETPDSGCCGMAGAWGYEAAHYDVSMAAGERVLLPAVRAADADTLIVADGFSCKTQIEQGHTGRRALHLAEVLALAREWGPAGPPRGSAPEGYVPPPPAAPAGSRRSLAAAGAATGAVAAGAWALRRRRS